MKAKFTIILILLWVVNISSAQESVERKISMSLGPQNAFYVEIQGADKKTAEKTFYEFTKEYGKFKENSKAREHFMMATKIPVINGQSPIDMYAKFEEGKNLTTAYVWVDLGGAFVNTEEYPSQAKSVKQFMYDYYIAVRKKVVSEELKAEEKSLTGLEKDLRKLKDKNDDYRYDIEKAKQKIAEAEKNIDKNLSEQENKSREIENQKTVVSKVTEKLNNLGKKD
jgi:chromosome segregation ATPase